MTTLRSRITTATSLLVVLSACSPDATGPVSPARQTAAPALAAAAAPALLQDNFDAGTLDPAKWQIATVPGGRYSLADGGIYLTNRTHLNTAVDYIPWEIGGIRVTGDWTVTGAGDDFIQILTRSNGVPGCCAFETQSGIGFTAFTNQVGEAPNLMTISQGSVTSEGSLVIQPGVKYHFLVEDDGRNVLFRLTRADDPTQTRTVRSTAIYASAGMRVVFHNREVCCGGDHTALLDNVRIESIIPPNVAPTITIGAAAGTEGSPLPISISADDANGDALTVNWDLGDGTTGTGPLDGSHVYADDGTYQISVTASDGKTPPVTATQVVTVANVAPGLSALPGDTLLVGESYAASGSFTDPGADVWTATVDYGAGAGALALTGKTFALSHTFTAAGSYAVTVEVSDGDGGEGQATASVVVLSPAQGVASLSASVTALVTSGAISRSTGTVLGATLKVVETALERGNTRAAAATLTAFDSVVDAMVRAKRVPAAVAADLKAMTARLRAAL